MPYAKILFPSVYSDIAGSDVWVAPDVFRPKGQTLVAMLVAQVLNGHRRPVYGAYVIGSDWRFMVLTDQQYTISRDYSALSDEIFDILRILKGLKQIVMGLTA